MERSSTSSGIRVAVASMGPVSSRKSLYFATRLERACRKGGRPCTRPDGALDRGRQPGRGPVAGKPEILPGGDRPRALALLRGQRRERRPPLAYDLPGWHGGGRVRIPHPDDGRNLVPDGLGERLAWRVEQAVGAPAPP